MGPFYTFKKAALPPTPLTLKSEIKGRRRNAFFQDLQVLHMHFCFRFLSRKKLDRFIIFATAFVARETLFCALHKDDDKSWKTPGFYFKVERARLSRDGVCTVNNNIYNLNTLLNLLDYDNYCLQKKVCSCSSRKWNDKKKVMTKLQ